MPNLLQMAMIGREFSDTVQFRSPPPAIQKAVFAVRAPIAHAMGYRGTYPQLSRSLATPDPPEIGALDTAAAHHFSMNTWIVPPQVSPTSKASSSAMP